MITRVNPAQILSMFNHMAKVHKGEIHSAYLDYEVYQLTHPSYGGQKYEQLCPLVVLEFK